MLPYARRIDLEAATIADFPHLSIYHTFYGYTSKDLGLYALIDHQIAGAAWIRRLQDDHGSDAFIDESTPVLNIAVLPQFRRSGIGSMMLEQLCMEAGALYDAMSVRAVCGELSEAFFSRHGFVRVEGSEGNSQIDGADTVTMLRRLEKAAPARPSDGYDPRRWMD